MMKSTCASSRNLPCTNNALSFPAHLRSIAGSCPRRGQDGGSLSQLLKGGLVGIFQHQRLQLLQSSEVQYHTLPGITSSETLP